MNWVQQFGTFCFLDNNQYRVQPHSLECLVAAGCRRKLSAGTGSALLQLQEFIDEKNGWVFGHLGYDLKNEIEDLTSSHPDYVGFPDLFFFEPEVLIRIAESELYIEADEPKQIAEAILQNDNHVSPVAHTLEISSRLSEEEYIAVVRRLQQHIRRGDCYEINFCQEFFSENAAIDPVQVYKQLIAASPNPFSALYRINDRWLICASPERYLQRKGAAILSQPIKGTSKRVQDNSAADKESREQLLNSPKDRSENVMVVDLVRNDLSRICREGTVKVDELYGIYSFPQVHQMISTVSGTLREGVSFTDIIRATFPMGSMTGAPKKRVMELIEENEVAKRGIFSGAVGYISPGQDFDFNVIIRSIMYNAAGKYLSFQAGSAITFYSDPGLEWEECLLKAAAIKKVLGAK